MFENEWMDKDTRGDAQRSRQRMCQTLNLNLVRENRAHHGARGAKQELCRKCRGRGKAKWQKSGEEEERERGKLCGL